MKDEGQIVSAVDIGGFGTVTSSVLLQFVPCSRNNSLKGACRKYFTFSLNCVTVVRSGDCRQSTLYDKKIFTLQKTITAKETLEEQLRLWRPQRCTELFGRCNLKDYRVISKVMSVALRRIMNVYPLD